MENTVLQWVATYGYFAIFSLLVLGIVGLPVPDEFLLTGCGFLVYQGHLKLIPTVASALADGAHSVFALSVNKGGRVLVPADKIAYVEFGAPEARRVGFGNIV